MDYEDMQDEVLHELLDQMVPSVPIREAAGISRATVIAFLKASEDILGTTVTQHMEGSQEAA